MEEIKPEVFNKLEFENRNKSKVIASFSEKSDKEKDTSIKTSFFNQINI